MSHFSTPERVRDPSCVLPDGPHLDLSSDRHLPPSNPCWKPADKRGQRVPERSHLLTARAVFLNPTPPRPLQNWRRIPQGDGD